MLKRLTIFCCVLLSIVALGISAKAQCKKADYSDVPHGANVFILSKEQMSGRVYGTVFLPNYEEAENIVVEIYNYGVDASKDSYWEVEQTLQNQKRIKACLTRKDGKFSFRNLKSGNYLLRIGTQDVNGFNEHHVIVTLKPAKVKVKKRGWKLYSKLGLKTKDFNNLKNDPFRDISSDCFVFVYEQKSFKH